jgi:preprotein translocase subunit SecA
MDYLREGIGLRGYAQRDPLVEYQREGFDMFTAIMDGIKEESVGFLFNLEVQLIDEEEDEDDLEEYAEEPMARELPSAPAPAEHDHRPQISAKGLERERRPAHLAYSAPSEDASAFGGGEEPAPPKGRTVTNDGDEFAGVGRNALCPCGSGKKYKRCHGAPGGPTGLTARVNG